MEIEPAVGTRVLDDSRIAQRRDVRLVAALLGLAALAFAIRFGGLAFRGLLDARISLDEGTYFAGAIAFVNGRLPYRDFSILHPPGLLYVLAPFAQLATLTTEMSGLQVARVAFMLLGALNTFLVGLVGARVNRATGVAAAALYAVWILPINSERSTVLIVPQVVPMLVALLALTGRSAAELTNRRVAVAGAAIGVTGVVQIWAAVPAIVILAWLVLRTRGRGREALRAPLVFVLSGAVTAGLLLIPMLLAAGPRMVQMIIFAQATRVHGLQTNITSRLQYLEGLEGTPLGVTVPAPAVLLLGVAGLAVILLAAWKRPAVRLWAAIVGSQVAVIMVLPIFLEHYRGWPAPLLALCLGAAVAMALSWLPSGRRALGYGAYAAVLLLFATITLARPGGAQVPVRADMPELLAARCVIADEGYVALRTQTLVRSLRNGCTIVPNPRSFAQLFNATNGTKSPKTAQAEYQQHTLEYFSSADVLLLAQVRQDGLTEATMAALRAEFPYETTMGPVLELRRQP
ncbi:MAG TPA: hypothetical protein VHR16_00555 [Candidatus Limnocylindrales bacterium]|jgi:hypothetical protein|nr:hypothetical protein [Candidatus Limnocylindrales bacterium]